MAMAKSEVEKYARRLHSRVPLAGGMIRRSACRKLAEDGSAAAVPHLVEALNSDDGQVCGIAAGALRALTAPSAVDALCALWAKSRDNRLGDIIRECRHVAAQPVKTRLLSALKAGIGMRPENASAVRALVDVLSDDDEEIAERAGAALRSLSEQEAVDALCALWVKSRDRRLGAIVRERAYVAAQPVQVRVLSALQAGQLQQAGESAQGVPVVVDALTDGDGEIAERAGSALRSLTQQDAVDALCALWVKSRDSQLGDVVRECRYVAAQPAKTRLLSALKAGIGMQPENASAVRALVGVLSDDDEDMTERAGAALRRLITSELVDVLCEIVIADPSGATTEIVREQGYEHSVVSRRCVQFVLTGQTERYLELDYEFQNLRAEYEAAGETLRQRIAQTVRQSGDTRLLGLFRTGAIRKRAMDLSRQEAEVVLDVYSRNERWAEIFGLLFHMPIASVIEALRLLGASGWRPDSAPDAAMLGELIASVASVGELPPPPPPAEVALGPVFGGWISRGQSDEFTSASIDALRQHLHEGPPPDAVAALSALSARGEVSADDIKTARTHRHWPVRVGCLALCEIAPEFAFSETPTGGEGGGMWIDMLAPPLLYSATLETRALHLNPEQVEALQTVTDGAQGADSQRAACGRVLCALGAHHLRHTIEVDDEMIVSIEETDIEIEVEG